MPLDYADFVHYYPGNGQSDEARRTHFETFADAMECIIRLIWQNQDGPNALGITLDGGTLIAWDGLESGDTLITSFNRSALPAEAGKKEP